jgi:uncharacterized OB-fold protein
MLRKLPLLTPVNTPFWQGGAVGELRICHCASCGRYFHPPSPACPDCASEAVAPRAVSGRATVASFTVNHQAWTPGLELPYAVAIVELVEQAALRLVTNIVGMPPGEIRIGMPVSVRFLQQDDVWLPLFERVA